MSNELAVRSADDIVLRPNYALAQRVQRETLVFRDTQIVFRNFAGKAGPYNEEGVRSFSILLDEALAADLHKRGMNVKPMRNNDDDGANPMFHLPVAVSFRVKPPRIYMVTGDGVGIPMRKLMLPEENVEMMDNLEFSACHMVVAFSNYDVRGTKGKKAYLQSFFGHVLMDELEQEYASVEDMLVDDSTTHAVEDNHPVIEGDIVY